LPQRPRPTSGRCVALRTVPFPLLEPCGHLSDMGSAVVSGIIMGGLVTRPRTLSMSCTSPHPRTTRLISLRTLDCLVRSVQNICFLTCLWHSREDGRTSLSCQCFHRNQAFFLSKKLGQALSTNRFFLPFPDTGPEPVPFLHSFGVAGRAPTAGVVA